MTTDIGTLQNHKSKYYSMAQTTYQIIENLTTCINCVERTFLPYLP